MFNRSTGGWRKVWVKLVFGRKVFRHKWGKIKASERNGLLQREKLFAAVIIMYYLGETFSCIKRNFSWSHVLSRNLSPAVSLTMGEAFSWIWRKFLLQSSIHVLSSNLSPSEGKAFSWSRRKSFSCNGRSFLMKLERVSPAAICIIWEKLSPSEGNFLLQWENLSPAAGESFSCRNMYYLGETFSFRGKSFLLKEKEFLLQWENLSPAAGESFSCRNVYYLGETFSFRGKLSPEAGERVSPAMGEAF